MAALAAAGRARVFLTDHNVLAGHQAGFAAAVEGIVDHHKDEGAYDDTLAYKNVDGYGSACTQVGEILRDAGGGDPVVAAIAEDPVVSCMGGGGGGEGKRARGGRRGRARDERQRAYLADDRHTTNRGRPETDRQCVRTPPKA
jgi:hypothetical protein